MGSTKCKIMQIEGVGSTKLRLHKYYYTTRRWEPRKKWQSGWAKWEHNDARDGVKSNTSCPPKRQRHALHPEHRWWNCANCVRCVGYPLICHSTLPPIVRLLLLSFLLFFFPFVLFSPCQIYFRWLKPWLPSSLNGSSVWSLLFQYIGHSAFSESLLFSFCCQSFGMKKESDNIHSSIVRAPVRSSICCLFSAFFSFQNNVYMEVYKVRTAILLLRIKRKSALLIHVFVESLVCYLWSVSRLFQDGWTTFSTWRISHVRIRSDRRLIYWHWIDEMVWWWSRWHVLVGGAGGVKVELTFKMYNDCWPTVAEVGGWNARGGTNRECEERAKVVSEDSSISSLNPPWGNQRPKETKKQCCASKGV